MEYNIYATVALTIEAINPEEAKKEFIEAVWESNKELNIIDGTVECEKA